MVCELLSLNPASTQIVPDNTLPVPSQVTVDGNLHTIEGGTEAGSSLFHSFESFSVPTGAEAFFNNATTIENILTRVTGGNLSNIDGLIRANGTANLFLINPNGIQFGANASLNIGGSFLSSTADRVLFEDGSFFSATEPNAPPLLTLNIPIGLQMGANPGAIQVNGSGHQLIFDIPTFAFIRDNRPAGLQVPSGQTLALIGGNISLNGGNLTAAGGRIELGSVAEPSTVSLISTSDGFTFGYDDITNFGDIRLSQAASVEASGAGGGNIQLQGRQISLTETSIVLADTLGAENGGLFAIRASESLTLLDSNFPIFPTGFSSQVALGATGNGGNLTIETPRFTLSDAALVQTITSGLGDSGDITIDTEYLSLLTGGQILTSTTGTGNAGTLTVRASEVVEIRGTIGDFISSGLLTSVERQQATGNGGNLSLETNLLQVVDGGKISANTLAGGDGGNISIQATEVEVSGVFINFNGSISGLAVNVSETSTGEGGSLVVNADRLRVSNGGQVTAETLGMGNAGNITLNVNDIEVEGVSEDGQFSSSITARSQTDFAAGSVNITSDRVSVGNGAEINVSSQGLGDSGNLNVTARNISLDNGGRLRAEVNGGSRGNINLNVGHALVLQQDSSIAANATGASTGGNINIDTSVLAALQNSRINADAVRGAGGNIFITTEGIFVSSNSQITASSQLGVDGIVAITEPEVDTSSAVVSLNSTPVDPANQVVSACETAANNTFIVTGNGGLPPDPTQILRGQTIWVDTRLTSIHDRSRSSAEPSPSPESESATPPRLLEASNWQVRDDGTVELVAVPQNLVGNRWLDRSRCYPTP
ncbi:MAG: S-layer family protein [Cyanobacteria bacterium SBC]|nr:S-layer family protein [Cyanobacteria bacterium SBC]